MIRKAPIRPTRTPFRFRPFLEFLEDRAQPSIDVLPPGTGGFPPYPPPPPPPNMPPVAQDDIYFTLHDHTLSVPAPGVLGNDYDPNGDAISIVGHSNPAHGTLTLNSNGSLTYEPAFHYAGPDSFEYTISDGSLTDSAIVSIYVHNSPPVAQDDIYVVNFEETLTVSAPGVLSNDYDPDGDAISITSHTSTSYGTLDFQNDGSFSYTPNLDYVGGDFFTYTITDGIQFATAIVSLYVTPPPDPTMTLLLAPPGQVPDGFMTPIHINDNFHEEQYHPADGNQFISDYMPGNTGHQIVDGDPDLQPGHIIVGPAGRRGALTWTIGQGVRVWWKPQNAWVEVTNINNYVATGVAIELRVEGNDIKSGSIQAKFTPNVGNPVQRVQFYSVYTGLRFTGAGAGTAVTQLETSTAYTLVRGPNGDVWRESGLVPQHPLLPAWKSTARTYASTILENRTVRNGTRVTVIDARQNVANVLFGSYDLSAIDVTDLGAIYTADARVGATIMVHELVEQYRKQIFGDPYLVDPNNEDGGGAHTHGRAAEMAIMGATGRTHATAPVAGGTQVTVIWTNGANRLATLIFTLGNDANQTVGGVTVTWP